MPPRSRPRRWLRAAGTALLLMLILAVLGFLIWSRTGLMAAEPDPLQAVQENPGIEFWEEDQAVVMSPADEPSPATGLVFYPGAKVAPEAYAARLSGLVTQEGMTVVIVKPWLNLALTDRRDLTTFTELAPTVDTWWVGGHSMGGVRACQLADDDAVSGLLLLASYCATDLSDSPEPVLSISGQEDLLSTPEKIQEARGKLPEDAEMVDVPGSNHASFGDYGAQTGDGTASVSDEDMTDLVTEEVARSLAEVH